MSTSRSGFDLILREPHLNPTLRQQSTKRHSQAIQFGNKTITNVMLWAASRYNIPVNHDIPSPTPPAIVLRPDKKKLLLYLLGCLAFVAIGIYAITRGEPVVGWSCVLFFGLGVPVFGMQFLPGASYLRLTQEGFVVCSLFRQKPLVSWQEASGFRVAPVPFSRTRLVVYDSTSNPTNARTRRVNRSLIGADEGLPDTYGMKPQDLADLLNSWRLRSTESY